MIVLSPGTRIHSTPKQGFMDNDYGTLDAFDTTTDDTTADTTDPWDDPWGDTLGDNGENVGTSDDYELSDGSLVSLSELEQGYLRQSDYTRKTQDLAAQRAELAEAEELMSALRSDPEGTLEALQRHLGTPEEVEDIDPLEQKVRDHSEFIEQQRAQSMQHEVESELAGLAEEYGDFDWNAVLEFAVSKEIPDLEAALLLMTKASERDNSRKEANEKALNAKRGAQIVSRGSRAQGQVSEGGAINSVMDAWNAAKRELGYE